MASHLGKEGVFKVSTTTVLQIRGYSLQMAAATVDSSVIGDTWNQNKTTLRSWQASGDLFWDPADTGQVFITPGQTITVNLYPMGISTATYYVGQGIVNQFDVTARHDSMVEASFAVIGTGPITPTAI